MGTSSHEIIGSVIVLVGSLLAVCVALVLFRAASSIRGTMSFVSLLLVIVLGFFVLYRSPFEASELSVSDSIEYTVAAHRLWFDDSYSLSIDGRNLPPRYPPTFSAFILSPAFALLGDEIGNPIFAVLSLALLGLVASFLLGEMLSPYWGGTLAALLMLLLPEYRHLSRVIMSDIPSLTLSLVLFLHFIQMRISARFASSDWFLAGLLIAFLASMRITNFVLALPFLFLFFQAGKSRCWKSAFVFFAPCALSILGQCIFNQLKFQTPWRSGYNLWVAVPYDYFSLTYSLSYLLGNLQELIASSSLFPLLIFLLIGITFVRSRGDSPLQDFFTLPNTRSSIAILVCTLVPLLITFTPYFFCHQTLFSACNRNTCCNSRLVSGPCYADKARSARLLPIASAPNRRRLLLI